ncbi:MAG: hydantoinase/oxoprolinase family protein [Solirubrobacterales bacterium]|nr:hydantoinase/oxoprolinase family protein [Solirubrobacterales bacterium]HMT04227.1 hydantoinase/oxoprolinase family protein [Solirubrobacterales bacterium]
MGRSDSGQVAGGILGVDVGGTFTDAVLITEDRYFTGKSPTTPDDQSEGVMTAIRQVLGASGTEAGNIRHFAHGMTVATNALLESKGAKTALVATRGFIDLVEIGRQDRASLYRLQAAHPPPLVPPERRIEAAERTGPDGILEELTEQEANRIASLLLGLDVESVAVCLLHSYRYPAHELLLGEVIRDRLGSRIHVSLSHEVVGTFREFERAATTEIDAALSPLLAGYLERLRSRTGQEGLPEPEIMQSSGGVAHLDQVASHAAVAILSGPAGGAAAASMVARESGEENLLCFDMGGTSCDVCVVERGAVHEASSKTIAGRPIALPMVDIDTVGAGGGSIAWRDSGGALRVGPESSGSRPGPACYGLGGTRPTVTDANLALGHLDSDRKLAGGISLDLDLALRAIGELAGELKMTAMECAEGIIRVANAEMVRALRVVTVQRGLDSRDFTLLAFGGAGPLHAAGVAEELGIGTVLIPLTGGVFSALGLAAAEGRRDEVQTVLMKEEAMNREVLTSLIGDSDQTSWDLRYLGQSFELTVSDDSADPLRLRELFELEHRERYGYVDREAPVELVTVRRRYLREGPVFNPGPTPDLHRAGPATIDLGEATLHLPTGWSVHGESGGLLRMIRER